MTVAMTQRNSLISAALRHLRDAEHLAEPGNFQSVDQALHLAGFGPECARKACLSLRWADKALGHELGPAGEATVELAISLDPAAQRYHARGWPSRFPLLQRWNPQCRYEATGTADEPLTRQLLAEARQAVSETVLALWTDGQLSPEAIP
jgi:hypothetical protein